MVNYYKTYKLVNIKDDFSKGTCPLGWVNFYQKFEIEKYTVFGRLILPKKNEKAFFFKNFGTTGLQICTDL